MRIAARLAHRSRGLAIVWRMPVDSIELIVGLTEVNCLRRLLEEGQAEETPTSILPAFIPRPLRPALQNRADSIASYLQRLSVSDYIGRVSIASFHYVIT